MQGPSVHGGRMANGGYNRGLCDAFEAAAYTFDYVSGKAYYIRVSPRDSGVWGQFAIRIWDFIPPVNDQSSHAVSLNIDDAFVVGSTVNATQSTTAYDVWYKFVGNGRRLRVSTCSEDTTTAHNLLFYDTYVEHSSYDFGSTSTNRGLCDAFEAAVYEFAAGLGKNYYIRVSPRDAGVWGQFALQVSNAPTSAPTTSP